VTLACTLNVFTQTQSSGGIGVGAQPASKTRLKVEAKPDPKWPKLATDGTCTIVLRAVFTKDGKVTNITFVKTVPEHPRDFSKETITLLTKRSIEAAKKIRFVPATDDGKPVSMWMQLEYNFSPQRSETKPEPDK